MFTDNYSTDTLWIEKYRARSLDELVLAKNVKEQIKSFIDNPQSMPHLIFIGPPGTGKTSVSRIICDTVLKSDMDLIVLNGSEQRGIDTIRNIVIDFLSVPPMRSPVKIVYIDECDYLSQDAWAALRHTMEKFAEYGRFIMTANESKIPKPIQSRCVTFSFDSLPRDKVLEICMQILKRENVNSIDISKVAKIISMAYPDLRKIVNSLQKFSVNQTLDLQDLMDEETRVINMTETYITMVMKRENTFEIFRDLMKIVTTTYLDYITILKTLFLRLDENYVPIKILISEITNRISYVPVPSMLFCEFLYKIKTISNEMMM